MPSLAFARCGERKMPNADTARWRQKGAPDWRVLRGETSSPAGRASSPAGAKPAAATRGAEKVCLLLTYVQPTY